MSKVDKLIAKLLSEPADFTWDELIKVLNHFGYKEFKKGKTAGSRRKFIDNSHSIISLHKPHPGNILKLYQIRQIIAILVEKGKIKNE